jgi:AraC-like DNA-binding protein
VLTSQPGHGLHRLAQFAVQDFLAESQQWHSPLVMTELQHMMLALFLEMLPRQPRPLNLANSGHQTASKAYADAAMEYILAHLDQPLSIGCISKQVGVHPRTLHKVFRRHLHTSPMAYIKARRLEQVRKQLRATDPGDSTITQTASSWGFNNLGHFAVDYRKAFGESPSATLRRAEGA